MVWGCMTALGVGYACRIIEYPMKSELYTHILNTTYKETLQFYGLTNKNVIFQQDGDSKHTSNYTLNWLRRHRIKYIEDWPPNSPDLNPIENLWHCVKRRLTAYESKPRNIEELWERFDKEWAKFTPEEIEKYYEGIPKRIEEVIKSKGRITKH